MSPHRHEPTATPGADADPTWTAAASGARRRLLRGCFGAAPILLAASPRSVMASSTRMTGSLPASLSTSATRIRSPLSQACGGWTPSTWYARHGSDWPSSCTRNTKFLDIFGADATYGDRTLAELLGLQAVSGKDCLVKHVVAALLNARANKVPSIVAGESIVKMAWNDYNRLGYYEPTAGVRWGCDAAPNGSGGITPWLKSTMAA